MNDRRFIPHPDAERFDKITVETVERWKESELSGDEWRFSYLVTFWWHGQVAARRSYGGSLSYALRHAVTDFDSIKLDDGFGTLGGLDEVCCQPGCPNPWTVLLHPIKAYSKGGDELARPHRDNEVRGFCEGHRHRGDCGLEDNDLNYVLVEERFPPNWAEAVTP